jgi:hypothetical protein
VPNTTKTNSKRKVTVGTMRKSVATNCWTWFSKKCAKPAKAVFGVVPPVVALLRCVCCLMVPFGFWITIGGNFLFDLDHKNSPTEIAKNSYAL